MSDLASLHAQKALLERRIHAAAASDLLADLIEAFEAFDVHPATVTVTFDTEDDGSEVPLGWVEITADDDDADIGFATEEVQGLFNAWQSFLAFGDSAIALYGRDVLFGKSFDLHQIERQPLADLSDVRPASEPLSSDPNSTGPIAAVSDVALRPAGPTPSRHGQLALHPTDANGLPAHEVRPQAPRTVWVAVNGGTVSWAPTREEAGPGAACTTLAEPRDPARQVAGADRYTGSDDPSAEFPTPVSCPACGLICATSARLLGHDCDPYPMPDGSNVAPFGHMSEGARRVAVKAIKALLPDLTHQQAVNAADGDLGAIDPTDRSAVTAITEACTSGRVTCRSVVHLIGRQGADARIEGRGDRILVHGRAGAVEAVEGAWQTAMISRTLRTAAAVPTGLPPYGGDPLRAAKRLARIARDGQPG
ncbi:hypothetical protein DVS28_b0109 (plasmid) [Euzebya pacifica]|uniref:Uncharacterized protein n=1 Tax=Euzebya pacifica TaxID=1608957 RepID=A0A346Y5Y2_9ACTN|nr:hypothetical protein [Euzebya pacifica]AXV09879.1 hypothetical protein DVS28_b0109 [Euzebya pacifica]